MSEDYSTDKVEWNMANLLNIELARLRSKANDHWINKEYSKAVDTLMAMKMTGGHVMHKEERVKLTSIEQQLEIPLAEYMGISSVNTNDVMKGRVAVIKVRRLYLQYNELVMDLLEKYGFLGGRKKDAGRMKI